MNRFTNLGYLALLDFPRDAQYDQVHQQKHNHTCSKRLSQMTLITHHMSDPQLVNI